MGGIAAQDFGGAYARRGSRTAVESWTLTVVQVERWLRSARQGDVLAYAHGPTLVQGDAAARIRKLIDSGEVIALPQRRADDGGFDYRVVRNRVRVVKPPRAVANDVLGNPAAQAIFDRLQLAVERAERCPSDAALATGAGCTIDQAKWQLKKLAGAGLIATRAVPTQVDPKFRVVTICATGAETALPGGAA